MEPIPPDAADRPLLETVPTATSASPPAPAAGKAPLGRAARVALVAVAAAAAVALLWPRSPAARAPGGFLVDDGGKPVALASQLGPVTLVHFWATWCPPCLTEMPELVRYAREAGDPRLKVLLVAVGDEPAAAREFVGTDELPLLFDPAWDVANRYGTRQLPETHVLVGNQVVHSFIGAQRWSDPAVRAAVQKWTASPTSAAP
jgi:thiol-disulfide isomerase/thioredoxin